MKGGTFILNMTDEGWARMLEIHLHGAFYCTRALVRELGRFDIRVNAICPGAIDIPMTQAVPRPLIDQMVAQTPLQRLGTSEDIANAALFLASDESSFLTGQWISPNGGIVMM